MVEHVECNGERTVPFWLAEYDTDVIVNRLNAKGLVSSLDGKTRPIEGVVVRRDLSEKFYGGRLILKLLSDAYLLEKDNTDWH
jgi:hypothetical protein